MGYKNNFLTNVIFRLDFPINLTLQSETPSSFKDNIRTQFPKFQEETLYEYQFDQEKKTGISKTIPRYVFEDAKKTKKIIICHNHIVIEYRKYDNFSSFKKEVDNVMDNFNEIYNITVFDRIGLRYINNIKLESGNPLDWNGYFNPSLLNILDNFIEDKSTLSRLVSQIRLNKEDYELSFISGLHNPEYPNKISRKEYLLDYDCFTKNIEYLDISKKLISFNQAICELFEKSIEEKLREELNK